MSGIYYPQDLISRWIYFFGGGCGSGGGPAGGAAAAVPGAVPAGAGVLFFSFHFLTLIAFSFFFFSLANFLVSAKLIFLSLIA